MKTTIGILIASIVCGSVAKGSGLEEDLAHEMERLAQQKNLPEEQVRRTAFSVLLNQEFFPLGRAGALRDGCYLMPFEPLNQILLPTGKKWTGSAREVREVVFLFVSDGGDVEVSNILGKRELLTSCLLVFEPSRITVVDFSKGIFGFYRRGDELGNGQVSPLPALSKP